MHGSYTDLIVENRGLASWIILNRPESLNSLTPDTYSQLIQAFEQCDSDDETQFIVLTGAGRGFCAGDDFNSVFQADDALVGSESGYKYLHYKQTYGAATETVRVMLGCCKPMIAAVNGAAVGMGMDLSLLCDIRVASNRAKLGAMFVNRGFCGTVGGTALLPRIIGLSAAMELLLSGEIIQADHALSLGLFSQVVEAEELEGAVSDLIDKLSLGAPLAQRSIKRIVRKGMGVDLVGLEEYTRLLSDPLWDSKDHQEGINSFVEGRRPVFSAS